jgi:hypothetical protein
MVRWEQGYPSVVRTSDARSFGAPRLVPALLLLGVLSLLAGALSLSTAADAGALEPGVHADPGSPAAKEYALPLTQARQTGSGHGGGLFGAGIGRAPRARGSLRGDLPLGRSPRRDGSAGAHPAPARSGSGGSGRAGGGGQQGGASQDPLPSAVQSAARARPGSGSGSILALLGGGVAVLALGALGGTVLRGRHPVRSRL